VKQLPLKYVKTSELNPAAYNPRDITEAAFEGLKESVKKFGLVDPLIVNVRTGLMVAGHQRLKVAQALKHEFVPVIEVDLSPSEEKALNVTLNNQAISGHYTDSLQELLEEIASESDDGLLESLRMDTLKIDTNWDADSDALDKIDPNLDGIIAKVKVECPQEVKDDVKQRITEALEGIEGVTVS